MIHPAALDPERLLAECDVRFTRRSGPGGQNRNKVETAVILTHRPTGITAEASDRHRDAAANRLPVGGTCDVLGSLAGGADGDLADATPRDRDRHLAAGADQLIEVHMARRLLRVEQLRELVHWAEQHSPVGDALRRAVPLRVDVVTS